MSTKKYLDLDGLSHVWLLMGNKLGGKVDKAYKTGSQSEYKVLSDNNLTDEMVTKINNASTFSGDYNDLTNKPQNLVQDANYVHTDNNFTTALKNKLNGIEAGAEANVIEEVQVNGTALTPDANKSVNVEVPITSVKVNDDTLTITNHAVNIETIGRDVEGVQYTVDGETYTADAGAEIFNDYRSRTVDPGDNFYNGNVAIGTYSHAEGRGNTTLGTYSHAEGLRTSANGDMGSHAEGFFTFANGGASHTEGQGTVANGNSTHAEGYNANATGDFSHAEGNSTVANGNSQHVQGKYNLEDNSNTYAHIVGNGYYDEPNDEDVRSNAHTIDWQGNGWFAGDVYVGSTSGTNKDAGSKKLATEEYVDQNGGKIDAIQVNGTTQTITNKTVNITVPTNNNQLTNGAGYQTASDVSSAISTAIGGITSIDYQVVATLPASGVKGTIYLVSNSGTGTNIYDEYIWVNNAWEFIGTTAVDLTNYLQDSDVIPLTNAEIDSVCV